MNAYLTFNFFGYEQVNPPPEGIPEGFGKVYLTDDTDVFIEAGALGWEARLVPKNVANDPWEKRKFIAAVKIYPELFLGQFLLYEKIFVTDSDVIKLDSNYEEFVAESLKDNRSLYVTGGYYSGERDTISAELTASLGGRWDYNKQEMIAATAEYVDEVGNCPVISAKFIGWNMKSKHRVDHRYYRESLKHLQGNIILSYLAKKYPEEIMVYGGFKNDVIQSPHKEYR
jgi:hypothetical protein